MNVLTKVVTLVNTADSGLVKRINTSIVLEALRRTSPTSRAAIAQLTGLNKATVSNLVTELMAGQYAVEIGSFQTAARGRRPRLVVFNAQAGMVVGAELDVHNLHVLVTDLEGRIVWRHTRPLPLEAPYDQTLPLIAAGLQDAIDHAPPTPRGVVGVGLGVVGLVDAESGMVLEGVNVGWRNVPLAGQLTERLGVPVHVENSGGLSALGELRFGAGRGVENLVYIHAVLGLGGGLVLNGALHRGTRGYAGELGHMVVEPGGLRCRCGNRGCWELYASELALRRHLQRGAPDRYDAAAVRATTVAAATAAAERGDPAAIAAFEDIGRYLGLGMANLVNALNPELVILGGTMNQAGHWVQRPAERALRAGALGPLQACVRMAPGALGSDAAALGAASVVLETLFASPRVVTGAAR